MRNNTNEKSCYIYLNYLCVYLYINNMYTLTILKFIVTKILN